VFNKDKLKVARLQKRMTYQALADKVGASKSYIWELENKSDKALSPNFSLVCRLCRVLGKNPNYFMTEASNG